MEGMSAHFWPSQLQLGVQGPLCATAEHAQRAAVMLAVSEPTCKKCRPLPPPPKYPKKHRRAQHIHKVEAHTRTPFLVSSLPNHLVFWVGRISTIRLTHPHQAQHSPHLPKLPPPPHTHTHTPTPIPFSPGSLCTMAGIPGATPPCCRACLYASTPPAPKCLSASMAACRVRAAAGLLVC